MEEQFPEVVGNSHYEKLWNHLDRRELRDFGLTKVVYNTKKLVANFFFKHSAFDEIDLHATFECTDRIGRPDTITV